MEEKNKQTEIGVVDNNNQKLSYDQLNVACAELLQQNQQLSKQCQVLAKQFELVNNAFKRLDYLFKVIEYKDAIGDIEFVKKCVDEIKSLMTLPPEANTEKEEVKKVKNASTRSNVKPLSNKNSKTK